MKVALAAIPPILRIADICSLLRISERQFYVLKAQGFFATHGLLVEVQPAIDRNPRYSGSQFVEFLSDRNQARLFRLLMSEVEKSGVR